MAAASTLNLAVQNAIANAVAFFPQLIGAVIILIIGWLVGRAIGRIVRVLADRSELDRRALDTPIGQMMGRSEQAISRTIGKIAKWFVYALTILAAADILAIRVLSEWISAAVSYLPAFIGGLLIILFGFIVADFIGDMIERTMTTTETSYTRWFATGVRMFLYFIVIVIGLSTMKIDVQILYLFARAVIWGLAAALAIGAGIAIGWGTKDYIANNIDDWVQTGRERSQEMQEDDE